MRQGRSIGTDTKTRTRHLWAQYLQRFVLRFALRVSPGSRAVHFSVDGQLVGCFTKLEGRSFFPAVSFHHKGGAALFRIGEPSGQLGGRAKEPPRREPPL